MTLTPGQADPQSTERVRHIEDKKTGEIYLYEEARPWEEPIPSSDLGFLHHLVQGLTLLDQESGGNLNRR
jgi:hypothetical protein